MSVIAFDYGTRYIGVAGGDLSMKIATPREVIENKSLDFVMEKVIKMVNEWQPELFVIGLPVNMEEGQSENPIMKDILIFAERLESLGKKVEYFDESLSSFEAQKMAEDLGKKSYQKDDALAAQVILQRYFDSLAD